MQAEISESVAATAGLSRVTKCGRKEGKDGEKEKEKKARGIFRRRKKEVCENKERSFPVPYKFYYLFLVKCGVNERYYQCTPSCKNTCENFNNPGVRCQCGPPGCFCREGLVRRSDGRCIIPSQCPAKCGDNEEYYLCPPSCKNTCENYTNPNVQCQCGSPGCFCKRGLVKTEDGRCAYPTQCIKKPSRCQENAEYLTCGPSCRPTCKNPYTGSCPARCVPGCFCKPGFVEDHDGRCVHLERCEKRNFVTLMSFDIFRVPVLHLYVLYDEIVLYYRIF
ncbi:UNVERIFIED_CONTAM: Muc6 [Trichonephila clavipes]